MEFISASRLRGYSDTVRALAVAVALLALVAAACGADPKEDQTVAAPTVSEPDSSDLGRQPAPALDGVTLDGDPVSLSDYRGRPVLINVWSSW